MARGALLFVLPLLGRACWEIMKYKGIKWSAAFGQRAGIDRWKPRCRYFVFWWFLFGRSFAYRFPQMHLHAISYTVAVLASQWSTLMLL